MADATLSRSVQNVRVTAVNAVAVGEVRQLPGGLCGASADPSQAYNAGDRVDFATDGSWVMPKNPAVNLLDGGRAFWDFANARIDYKRSNNARDFFAGRLVGDALAGASTCTVQINANPPDAYDLARDPFYCAPVGTQALGGFLPAQRFGGAVKLKLSSTNEAQKVDALGKSPGWLGTGPAVVELAVEVVSLGAGATPVLCVGVASGTHATAVTSVAQYLVARVNGNSTAIQVEASDGTTTVAPTNTGAALTVGARFEVWFDLRTPSAAAVYVNGLRVLSGTAFNLGAAASAWLPLAHLVKTASADVFEADVDWLRVRTMRL